jgi:hypothetical protein
LLWCRQLHFDAKDGAKHIDVWSFGSRLRAETGMRCMHRCSCEHVCVARCVAEHPLAHVPCVHVCPLVLVVPDILAFAALLLVLRFVRHLSLLPGMGPMLLAIVKTWHDATVILYVGL